MKKEWMNCINEIKIKFKYMWDLKKIMNYYPKIKIM